MKLILLTLSLILTGSSFAGVAVVGSLARNKTVRTGETFEGIILIKNTSDQASEVQVYQTDYLFFADGKNLYEEPGSSVRSNADWISFAPTRLNIPAKETASVHYKGEVPTNPDLQGAYWSMVMVEPLAAPAPVVNGGEQEIVMGIKTILRFGIQIVTQIGDTGSRDIKILDKKLVREDGGIYLRLDIENTGERMLVPLVWTELFNQQGISIGRFECTRRRIYPACSVRFSLDISGVPEGNYTALVVIDNGDDHVLGAQYQLGI